MLDIKVDIKDDFGKSEKQIKRMKLRVLGRQGAFLRGAARRKIRRTNNPNRHSKPGYSPYTHTGKLKQAIEFRVDEDRETAVIGARKSWIGVIGAIHEHGGSKQMSLVRKDLLNKKFKKGDIGPVNVGRYSEYSGIKGGGKIDPLGGGRVVYVQLKSIRQAEHATRLNRRLALQYHRKSTRAKYPERPFMAPALRETASKLKEFWQNAITK